MNNNIVKIGVIGLGPRAETLLATLRSLPQNECQVTAVCDLNTERIEKICNIFKANSLVVPAAYTDYKKLIADPEVQAVLIPTSWNSHLAIAADVMKAGKYAAIEVGGAASLDELWQLVHNSENFGGKCMMLENCCYGRNELMVLNMVRQGLLGEIVHCSCGFHLREIFYRQIFAVYDDKFLIFCMTNDDIRNKIFIIINY